MKNVYSSADKSKNVWCETHCVIIRENQDSVSNSCYWSLKSFPASYSEWFFRLSGLIRSVMLLIYLWEILFMTDRTKANLEHETMIRTCRKRALTIYGKTKEVSRNHKTKWSNYWESGATFYFYCPLGKEKWDRGKTNTHNYISGCVKRFESLRNAWMIYILKTTYYGPFYHM